MLNKPLRILCLVLSMAAMLLATAALSAAELPTQAACRIRVDDRDGATSCGSGTLVDVESSGERGLVITNAHVVRDRRSDECLVVFADGRRHGARIVAVDERIDAAALLIAKPGRQAAVWTDSLQGQTFRGLGFGPSPADRLLVMPGQIIADYGSGGQHSISLNTPFRDGDSGGGLFDEEGRFCGLIWGSTAVEGFCVHPQQVAAFITANGGKAGGKAVVETQFTQPSCYIDASGRQVCPLLRPSSRIAPPAAAPPAASPPRATTPVQGCDCRTTIASLEARVKELESRPPAQGPPGERGPAGPQGPAGKDGKDAQFDQQAVAAALAAALPPINVEQRDYYTGELLDSGKVNLGGTLVLRYGVKGAAAPGVNDARPQ